MAPIRRYLRITQHSVLEVRIYLDDPTLADSWLLDPRRSILPRVIQAVRPLVLPKLREENERSKGKGKKAKGLKDTVTEEDFEVSIFLTETTARHSLLTKQKVFWDKNKKLHSNSGKLTGWVTSGLGTDDTPVTINEESDEEAGPGVNDFPEAPNSEPGKGNKRSRTEGDDEALFVADEPVSDDEGFLTQQSPAAKKARLDAREADDKKKLGLKTAYEGFSIYGRVLCLIVRRRGYKGGQSAAGPGQQMMESWVSTQAAAPELQMPD